MYTFFLSFASTAVILHMLQQTERSNDMRKRSKIQATPAAIANAWSVEFNRLRKMGIHLKAAEYFAGVARRCAALGVAYTPYVPARSKDFSLYVPPYGPTLESILRYRYPKFSERIAPHGWVEKECRANLTINVIHN